MPPLSSLDLSLQCFKLFFPAFAFKVAVLSSSIKSSLGKTELGMVQMDLVSLAESMLDLT